MKTIYIRVRSNDKFGYKIVSAFVYKEYPEYGIAITRYREKDYFNLTDINTGMGAGKSFKKLKDAKSFVENNSVDFKNWYDTLLGIRQLPKYQSLCIKVR